MKHDFLECGKIINTHGFRGAVKLESWCDSPRDLAGLSTLLLSESDGFRPLRVLRASVLGAFVIAELEGVDSEERANALRGKIVYAPREAFHLPPDGYFLADVLGLPVRDADTGALLGEIRSVDTRGRSNLFTVKTPHGDALLPDVSQFVVRVDVTDALYVRPIPGLLDGGAENV